VRFAFTDDQLAFRDAARDLLEKQCGPEAVRAAWKDESAGYDPGLWRRLAEMGVLGALAPEAAGGLGLSELDLVLVLEESGRAAMPGPLVEHAAVAVPLLASSSRGRQWLEGAVAGQVLVTVGLGGPDSPVPWAEQADVVLLADGDSVKAVPAPPAVDRRASVDRSRRAARLDRAVAYEAVLDDTVLADTPPADSPLAGADVGLAFDRGALATAAQLLGLSERLIEMTVDYAKARHQFGVPIGSYQAVKHHLANALLRVEFARPCVYRAAYSIAHLDPDRSRDVSLAKAYANEAASLSARVALQCHGAIGYTYEHDLHLWMKRVWALRVAWGDTAFHRSRVAAAILGPA